jgi:hypothetical protein
MGCQSFLFFTCWSWAAFSNCFYEHLFILKGEKEMASFKHILANFPSECNAAATVTDISPHLCFICLLHLANEKELSIQSCPNLDDLHIYMPTWCCYLEKWSSLETHSFISVNKIYFGKFLCAVHWLYFFAQIPPNFCS